MPRTAKQWREVLTRKQAELDQLLAEFDRGGRLADWLPHAQQFFCEQMNPPNRTDWGFAMSLLVVQTQLLIRRIEARLLELEREREV